MTGLNEYIPVLQEEVKSAISNMFLEKSARAAGRMTDSLHRHYELVHIAGFDPRAIREVYHFNGHIAEARFPWGVRYRASCVIARGDWGLHLRPFERESRYRWMANLYENRDNFRRSDRYRQLVEALERIGPGIDQQGAPIAFRGHDLTTLSGIESYCQSYVRLFESLREHGFIAGEPSDLGKFAVTSEGTLVKWYVAGFHRLAASQLVGLAEVQGQIAHFHPDWLRARCGRGIRQWREHLPRALAELGVRVIGPFAVR